MINKPSIAVLVTGSEVLDGRVLDTNSHYVAEQLSRLGLRLGNVLSCDDDLDEMVSCLEFLARTNQMILTSGGLGPTEDDLTRAAVARYCGVELTQRPEALDHLRKFFEARKRILEESNLQQALLPVGSEMIPNPVGTAPGFVCRKGIDTVVLSLSGVPSEFQRMFQDSVLPRIEREFENSARRNVVGVKVFGLPESVVGKLVKGLALPPSVSVSYRAVFPEVHVALKAVEDSSSLELKRSRLVDVLGNDFVFSEDLSESFESRVLAILEKRGFTIATAESCTGGMVSGMLTNEPGASKVFRGGVCVYSNDLKTSLVGVSLQTIETFGAVSAEVAEAMAAGVKERLGASVGVSVTGIAGPEGGSEEKPVGTFYIGFAGSDGVVFSQRFHYSGNRQSIRRFATYVALEVVRRTVEGFQIPASLPYVPQSKP